MKKDLYLKNNASNFGEIFNWFIGIIMVGAQQFSLPLIPYFVVIFLGEKKTSNFFKNKTNVLILFLISLSILSLFIRNYPFLESIKVSRFFFGLPFLYLFLSSKLSSRLRYPIVVGFLAWNLIEIISLYVTGEPPFYINNYFLSDGVLTTEKAYSYGRSLGPVINASINGTIAACILIASLFNKEIIFSNRQVSRFQKILIPVLSSIVFFRSASGTGYAIITILLINKLIWPTFVNFFRNFRITVFSFTLLILGAIASYQIFVFFPILYRKINGEYISYIIQFKINEISNFLNLGDIGGLLVGLNYDPQYPIVAGDFILLSLISTFGIGFLSFLIFILLKIFPSNRIYFFALLISSLHYGTLFTVTGQVICSIVFSSNKEKISSSKFDFN